MIRKNNRGFTLIETTLVLIITISLLRMTVVWGPRQPQVAERAFWPAWQRLWTSGCERALAKGEPLQVRIDSVHRRIVLETREGQGLERLSIPETLKLSHGRPLLVIYPSGGGQSQTLWWVSSASGHRWKQSFQLGGGLFYVS
ncbi:type II secretion system protein [Levilactobacillus tangyuanensis]|uniref:Type II secretion system protein n=1 Tax=Levilactobacillus tangyuanensis TaxID=2486021 RepID=A0ABW1TQE3_9LACO|nr:type II secretion system protein [Levilactobacillus tangyuanensis]